MLNDLVSYFEANDFGPDYIVASEGELKKAYKLRIQFEFKIQEIFLVSRGSVKVVYSDLDQKKSKICKEGDLIDADGLFWFSDSSFENRRNYSIVSVGYSEVL